MHGADELAEAQLRAAVSFCCRQRDVLGRTPLHYASRSGHLSFAKWVVSILCTRPKAATVRHMTHPPIRRRMYVVDSRRVYM